MASTPIIDLDPATEAHEPQRIAPALPVLDSDEGGEAPVQDEMARAGIGAFLPPALAIMAATGWSVLFLTARHDVMAAGGTAGQWVDWLLQWLSLIHI